MGRKLFVNRRGSGEWSRVAAFSDLCDPLAIAWKPSGTPGPCRANPRRGTLHHEMTLLVRAGSRRGRAVGGLARHRAVREGGERAGDAASGRPSEKGDSPGDRGVTPPPCRKPGSRVSRAVIVTPWRWFHARDGLHGQSARIWRNHGSPARSYNASWYRGAGSVPFSLVQRASGFQVP